MILVTGAGGTVGTALVHELKAKGKQARLAFHTPVKVEQARAAGHDAVLIDYLKTETLAAAMAGVHAVFVLGAGGEVQVQGETNVLKEAKAAGVNKLVKLSVWAADGEKYDFARIHRRIELEIERSGLAYTLLRPNGFMQNFDNYLGDSIRGQNAIYLPAGDAKISFVDVRDIASVAALALTSSEHDGKTYALSGSKSLSYKEAAQILSSVLERPISYIAVDDDAAKAGMTNAGIPEFFADHMVDLNRFYRADG
ncbi:MAG: hypothetical protein JWN04_4983, partial [Myxococcaceae bacterium]|nr:hypothetical protein [Myxococcaceae bacterium]